MKAGWQFKPLDDICAVDYGTRVVNKRDGGTIYPVYGSGGATFFMDEFNREDCFVIARFAMSEQCTRFVSGKFFLNDSGLTVSEKSGAMLPRFLDYQLLSKNDEIYTLGRGTAQKNLDVQAFRCIRIAFPEDRNEQHRIVAILDEAFENIASAKANAEQNLKNARALFESHLQAVFTQRGEGWVEKTLGDVCNFVGGSQPPKSEFTYKSKPDHVRLIQIRDYKSDKHLVYIPRSLARRFCKADDVMIGRYGPPLFQILRGLEGAYNVALMKAEPDESKITRDFLFFFLKHPAMLQHVIYHSSRAAGQIGLTKETLEPYPIYLPSLAGQKKVMDKILQLETDTQRLESIYKQKIAALDELKKALLHKAFAGEL